MNFVLSVFSLVELELLSSWHNSLSWPARCLQRNCCISHSVVTSACSLCFWAEINNCLFWNVDHFDNNEGFFLLLWNVAPRQTNGLSLPAASFIIIKRAKDSKEAPTPLPAALPTAEWTQILITSSRNSPLPSRRRGHRWPLATPNGRGLRAALADTRFAVTSHETDTCWADPWKLAAVIIPRDQKRISRRHLPGKLILHIFPGVKFPSSYSHRYRTLNPSHSFYGPVASTGCSRLLSSDVVLLFFRVVVVVSARLPTAVCSWKRVRLGGTQDTRVTLFTAGCAEKTPAGYISSTVIKKCT